MDLTNATCFRGYHFLTRPVSLSSRLSLSGSRHEDRRVSIRSLRPVAIHTCILVEERLAKIACVSIFVCFHEMNWQDSSYPLLHVFPLSFTTPVSNPILYSTTDSRVYVLDLAYEVSYSRFDNIRSLCLDPALLDFRS